jgi:RNA polymerase sigma factor (sigma-70 family)
MSRKKPSDHTRFDTIYAANLPLILSYAARRCDEPSDAADVAAEVFLVAWRRIDDVPDGEERMWLYGVARRVLANQRRGHVRRNKLSDRLRDELARLPVAAPPPSEERAAAVLDAMRQLPERDRELLQLAVWDGLSPTEIATLEQVPAATVRSRLMRARARLREALGEPVAATTQREARDGHVLDGSPVHRPEHPELSS